jgi:hypothetical protein
MSLRAAGLLAGAVLAFALPHPPPPLFSPEYTHAVQEGLDLGDDEARALEGRLLAHPEDLLARLKLLVWYRESGPDEGARDRLRHIRWLIEHHPESEVAGSLYVDLRPGTHEAVLRAQWQRAAAAHPSDARVIWNAAQFWHLRDPQLYEKLLHQAVALAPRNQHYGNALGLFYAHSTLAGDPALAAHATAQLDATGNPAVLEIAVHLFQSEYNRSLMWGREDRRYSELAQRYFRRAVALDPSLDRELVLPQIRPDMVGMLAPGAKPRPKPVYDWDGAARKIRRLPPDAFPQLSATVAAVLRARGCRVPQPDHMIDAPGPVSIIRGQFFAKGQSGWAVLCSKDGFSTILVFRSDADGKPVELAKSEDKAWLQSLGGDRIGYSRMIQPVGQGFILRHYRAYGGPQPPPIDHEGIDDIFLGKASQVHYYHQGNWLKLTGAD